MKRGKRRHIGRGLVVLAIACGWACTIGPKLVYNVKPQPPAPPVSGGLLAGAAEVDITPPPGLSPFGYSVSARRISGYWLRLKGRVIVLQDAKGQRLALVQVDLGAVSDLLRLETARRVAHLHLDPGNLLIAASHTHGAPGNFFGDSFYNIMSSAQMGYNHRLLMFMAERLASGLQSACATLAPARLAAGSVLVKELSCNRSRPAWSANFPADSPPPYDGVIPRLYLVRIDRVDPACPAGHTPLAVWGVLPVHGTAVNARTRYVHGDLFGVASRRLRAAIAADQRLTAGPVAAMAIGPAADASPNRAWVEAKASPDCGEIHDTPSHGENYALALGTLVAERAFELYRGLGERLQDVELQYAYQEAAMPRHPVGADSALTAAAVPGVPAMGGAEDGRSGLYGKFGVREGVSRVSKKDYSPKVQAMGFLKPVVMPKSRFPFIAPLQVLRLGDEITLAAVPVEMTTETGRRIAADLAGAGAGREIAVVTVANNYMSYTATAEEYRMQHFEGALTLYGVHEEAFFREQLTKLQLSIREGRPLHLPITPRAFRPYFLMPIALTEHRPLAAKMQQELGLKIERDAKGRVENVRFQWFGGGEGFSGGDPPSVVVTADGAPLRLPGQPEESDEWLNFHVRLLRPFYWEAIWAPPPAVPDDLPLRIEVRYPVALPLRSAVFTLRKRR